MNSTGRVRVGAGTHGGARTHGRARLVGAVLAVALLGACDPTVSRGPVALEPPFDEVIVEHERRLLVTLPSCNGDPVVTTIDERDDEVAIEVVTTVRPEGDACADGIAIELVRPLGTRRVVDLVSGNELRLVRR